MDSSSSGPFALPSNCEVAIFISPEAKELITIEKICDEVGMGTLVILLNARLLTKETTKYNTDEAKKLFTKEFEPVFCLSASPNQQEAPNCLVYRSYPEEWALARKPKVGQPKVISTKSDRFTSEECKEAYDSIELSDIEKTAENVLDNFANWFK